MIDSNKRIPFESWKDFSHNCPHFSLQISEHHSFPIATTEYWSQIKFEIKQNATLKGKRTGWRERSRKGSNVYHRETNSSLPTPRKYILQIGQVHFTIWTNAFYNLGGGGMIIISKANSSVAPPAGKEEFHHFLPSCSAEPFEPTLQCPHK